MRRESRSSTAYGRDLLAGVLLLALTLGFFWRTVSGDVYQPADGGDLVSFLFPTYRFAAGQISQWILPLWNPHLYGGAPFISDIQAGFLYPPNLLLFLTNPDFGYKTMQWLTIGHLFWAGLGTYVLLRTLRFGGRFGDKPVSRPAALFAAIAFQFSDPLLIHMGNLNLIAVLAWLPWILAAFYRALRAHSWAWAAVTALLFAVANYAGHAQSSLYVGLAVGVMGIGWGVVKIEDSGLKIGGSEDGGSSEGEIKDSRLKIGGSEDQDRSEVQAAATIPSRRPIFNLQSSILFLFFIVLLTLLLTAPILLPAAELTQFTERSEFVYQDTVAYSLAPTQAIGLITPGFFGRGPALHWSLWDRVETPYAGVATLLLALGGLMLAGSATRRRLWPWAILAGFGFVTALGVYAILHGWLTLVMPGMDQFRAPARALVLWTLGVSVIAGVGFDLAARWPAQMVGPDADDEQAYARFNGVLKWGAILLAGIFTPLMYLALLLTQDNPTAFLRASVASLAITLAAGFWLGTWALIAMRRAGWFSPRVFAGLMVALLFADLAATGAYTDISPTDPTTGFQHPELVAFLKADADLFRIDTRTDIEDLWQPDGAALHGLQDVGGVANPLMLTQWRDLWESTGGRQSERYDQLNVKYVLVRDGTPLPEGKFELAFDAPGELAVYRNLHFLPRAWLAAPGDDLENLTPDPDAAPVTVTHYGVNEMALQVNSAGPGLLVLSEVWYPGWRATVNSQEVEVQRVNSGLRAVSVPVGASTVELRFAPRPWRWGLILLLVGLVGILVLLAVGWRRRGKEKTNSV